MFNNKYSLGETNNKLMQLILVLATIFVLGYFAEIYCYFVFITPVALSKFQNYFLYWVILPNNFEEFITKPWTLFTHFFLHISFWQLVGNLIWLYFFGFIFQDLLGHKKIFPLFILGGLAGGIIFLLSSFLMTTFHIPAPNEYLLGATTGVSAIVVAITAVSPRYNIFPSLNGGIPLYWATILFALLLFVSIDWQAWNTKLAVFGSMYFGYLYASQLQKGNNIGGWMEKYF